MPSSSIPPASPGSQPPTEQVGVDLPRFRGRSIPPIDSLIIKVLPPILIVALVITVTVAPDAASDFISYLRTKVTSGWTWYFVMYSLIAVALCTWLCFSKVGKVRLGGPKAKPEHSNFAWYSMLFACGQGIGLIFWSIAEPIMLKPESEHRVIAGGANTGDVGIVWTYFHWGLTAWIMYGAVAVCLAYSHHNLGKTLTFREATVDFLPRAAQRPAGVVVEMLAIIATTLGLATSFGFAAMQFSSGIASFTGLTSSPVLWFTVILGLGALTAVSAFMGVNKGMKRISELNSYLSVALIVGVFVFGPTVYILSTLFETFGSFIQNFISMSFYTGADGATGPLETWQDSWNGWWTVFIWCWVIAFSPFVAGFIARISRGRTIRSFVLGVTIVPSLIVMVWVGIIGAAGLFYDQRSNEAISGAIAEDTSAGLFAMLDMIPVVGTVLLVVATILVATYYVTSLDSGTYALAEFVSAPKKSGPWFRVILVFSIATVAVVLLSIGGSAVVDTVQTGTILGAFPFSFVLLIMYFNLFRRLRARNKKIKQLERAVNDPNHRPEDAFVDEHGMPIEGTPHPHNITLAMEEGKDPFSRTGEIEIPEEFRRDPAVADIDYDFDTRSPKPQGGQK
ncbi:BCCT family transporter [Helcobacillus massiliensis]|uniref:BCCT family transporter n=1 Tax=Helcobacillus massiliensis TaxID=521392 RepID=UPI0021A7371B|nr:BCCT family transporter [Helcobacillus massiliensis]MCT1557934.1 BCCT family transporter [Helcobacillus massiliensis]MCT2036558.1 BCCT family transporter [Helcobacillus massiliensis]MCT2332541.1 BCCT family transporter [Helcobacillus massiliensis]